MNDVDSTAGAASPLKLIQPWSGRRGVAVLVLLIVGGLLASGTLIYRWRTALPDDAVVRVSGKVVTVADLDKRLEVIRALYGVAEPAKATDRRAFRRDAAKSMALNIVIADAAGAAKIRISDNQVAEQLNALINGGYGGDRDRFISSLADNGVSQRQVKEELLLQLRSLFLFQKVTKEADKPSRAETKKYYDQNRSKMVTPERRTIDNVVVSSRAEANQVFEKAKSGVPFATLAADYSIDGATRDKGGALGDRAAAELESGYASAAFALKQPGLFGPIKTASGWNVGQVTKITKSRPVAYKDIADDIAAKMHGDRQLVLWTSFMKQKIDEADIEYADEYQPANPDVVPAEGLLPSATSKKG